LLIEEAASAGLEESSDLQMADFSIRKTEGINWKLSEIRSESVEYSNDVVLATTTEWLFGQVNRILPIKFGLRILIAWLQDAGKHLVLDWFQNKAAEEARRFGKLLIR